MMVFISVFSWFLGFWYVNSVCPCSMCMCVCVHARVCVCVCVCVCMCVCLCINSVFVYETMSECVRFCMCGICHCVGVYGVFLCRCDQEADGKTHPHAAAG